MHRIVYWSAKEGQGRLPKMAIRATLQTPPDSAANRQRHAAKDARWSCKWASTVLQTFSRVQMFHGSVTLV
jgi:hypothetical protein